MKKLFLILFILVSAVNLYSQVAEDVMLAKYSKPFLMPLLMMYFVTSSERKTTVINLGLLALFFSWIGDIILMLQDRGEMYFMLGLGAFLIAHIVYIITYKKARYEDMGEGLLMTQKVRYTFTLVLAGFALIYVLLPKLGTLAVPVIIYASVIVSMAIIALYRYSYTSMKSFGFVFFGAIVFMVSDSLIAINKFLEPVYLSGFWIMSTYILAQFLIIYGLLKHQKSPYQGQVA